MDSQALATTRIQRVACRLIVGVAAAALLLPGLGDRRVLTYHEVCFAQPAREMLDSGRWIVPEIAGVVYPDKPPLGHWAAALGMAAFGENEWAVRLPFALAGVALAVLVAELGMLFWNPLTGLVAGLVQLTSFYFLLQARLAECDILLTLAVTAALFAFAVVEVAGRPFHWRWALTLHACTAAAFLAKGPIGLAFIGAPIIAFLVLGSGRAGSVSDRSSLKRLRSLTLPARRGLLRWLHPSGLIVSLPAVVGWPAAALWSRPEILEGWKFHNVDRFAGALPAEPTTPIYYLWTIPLLLLPWTPWIALGWWSARNTERQELRRLRRLTLCWIIPGLVLISAASWRHKHYAIPLLPPLSLWGAVGLIAWARVGWRRGLRGSCSGRAGSVSDRSSSIRLRSLTLPARPECTRRSSVDGASSFSAIDLLIAVPLIVLFAVVGLWQSFGANGDVMWPLALWASAGVAVVTGLHAWRKPRWSLAAILIVVGACESWSLLKIVPRFDSYRDQASFAARIVDRVGSAPIHVPLIRPTPGVPLALPENQIAYYLPLTVRLLDIESDAEWVLAPARMQSTLHGFVAVDRCVSLRFLMTEGDRLTLFRKAAATAAPKRTAHAWMR